MAATAATSTARRGLWGSYMYALERHPLLTKAASASLLMGLGDVLAQAIEHRAAARGGADNTTTTLTTTTASSSSSSSSSDGAAPSSSNPSASSGGGGSMSMAGFDWKRTGRLMAYGFLASGPMMHGWYRILDTAMPTATLKTTITKLILDQTIAAPTLIGSFFVFLGAMEGKNSDEILEKLKRDYWPTMKVNWSVWPVINFVNFRFIPPAQRVLYVSLVSVVWNAYLSWVEHK